VGKTHLAIGLGRVAIREGLLDAVLFCPLVTRRHERGRLMIASNRLVVEWGAGSAAPG
jgi:hypothetical protein